MTENQPDTEAAARKRQEIGLSPRRVTAQAAVVRPPEQGLAARIQQWLVVALVAAMVVVTIVLVIARVTGGATDAASVSGALSAMVSDPTAALNGSLTLYEDFAQTEGSLVRDFQEERWSMGAVPDEGLYRIRMWPGVIAWSTMGVRPADHFRISTSTAVSADTVWGYGGVIGRYSSDQSLYMVQVDGKGRLRVLVQKDGNWSTEQDWAAYAALLPAGNMNELVVEDDRGSVSIYGNGTLLLTTSALDLPAGDSGVVAGSLQSDVAEANFDWVRFETLP